MAEMAVFGKGSSKVRSRMAETAVFVYIYLDDSNIFLGLQPMAQKLEANDARYRIRLHFENLLTLAHCNCPV